MAAAAAAVTAVLYKFRDAICTYSKIPAHCKNHSVEYILLPENLELINQIPKFAAVDDGGVPKPLDSQLYVHHPLLKIDDKAILNS